MRSATERTDSAGCQTRTFGEAASLLTDAKSRSVSYGSFVLRLGFTAVLVDVMSSV
jgi:hypothetical protein